ncbi:MAG: HDIG domain-containing protein [Ignavibacteria bacterium]|nr:HDIG domain-containing protein [Ignavibacteria bacterium]
MYENDRTYCLNLFHEYTLTDSLRKHGYAVSACLESYARVFDMDIDYWANVGLMHDFDYERFPSEAEHPFKGAEILRSLNFEEDFVTAIMSHTHNTGLPRDTRLRKTLFACDELAGFILAVTYVRPSRSIDDVEIKSVIKKLKDKAFARQVSREDIYEGVKLLDTSLDEHIEHCIMAMKARRELLGI